MSLAIAKFLVMASLANEGASVSHVPATGSASGHAKMPKSRAARPDRARERRPKKEPRQTADAEALHPAHAALSEPTSAFVSSNSSKTSVAATKHEKNILVSHDTRVLVNSSAAPLPVKEKDKNKPDLNKDVAAKAVLGTSTILERSADKAHSAKRRHQTPPTSPSGSEHRPNDRDKVTTAFEGRRGVSTLGKSHSLGTAVRIKAHLSTGQTSGFCVLLALPILKVSQMAMKAVHSRTGLIQAVLMAIIGWVCIMYAIQHRLVTIPFLDGNQPLYFPIVATFVVGYALIVFEEQTEISKASTALVLGVLIWVFIGTGLHMTHDTFHEDINETLDEVSGVVFFLLGALTVVEIMDAHRGFDIVTKAISATKKRNLLLVVGLVTFALSSIMDNLTVVIVMVSLIQAMVSEDDFRMKLGGIVVVTSNAGGAWTPIGDITTTMLYIGGQVTTGPLMSNLLLPSVLCMIGALGYEYINMDGKDEFKRRVAANEEDGPPPGQAIVFWGGLLGIISVPIFTTFTSCPPWSGMMLVLGMLGVVTSLLHDRHDERYSLKGALTRVELPDTLFFLGVLFAVGGLEQVGLLRALAQHLSAIVPCEELVAISLGFASAVVDNVPLVAASQGMYDLDVVPPNDKLWNLIAFCAASGGSMLVIGSAAGVAFMGIERNVSFVWYIKEITPAAFIGYLCGVAAILTQEALGLSVQ